MAIPWTTSIVEWDHPRLNFRPDSLCHFHLPPVWLLYYNSEIWHIPSLKKVSSQDSSVGSPLDYHLEGPGFKSRRLQLNFQLEEGCGRYSMQYAIKYGCIFTLLSFTLPLFMQPKQWQYRESSIVYAAMVPALLAVLVFFKAETCCLLCCFLRSQLYSTSNATDS